MPSPTTSRGLEQIYALLLLLIFLAQALYLAARTPLTAVEIQFLHPKALIATGAEMQAALSSRLPLSPLTALMARAGLLLDRAEWLARLPFAIFGALLGASLWYIARRFYGAMGGFIALALYSFSPAMIAFSARAEPAIPAAWGAFGTVFTGIAVAHTLYAPRAVFLWNWRRILMLGLALGLGTAALFPVVIVLPLTLLFILYLVPERRAAALAIVGAACVLAFALLVLLYRWQLPDMERSARALAAVTPGGLTHWISWRLVGIFFLRNGPAFVLLLIIALIGYAVWIRPRFFGNTAPLLSALLLIVSGLALPHVAGASFLVVALPFVFIFVAGVCADLLETRYSSLLFGVVFAVLLAHAYFSLLNLLLRR